jgi:hypothetical protein
MDELGAGSSLRAVDSRFLLPSFPRTATVLSESWVDGLRAAGIELVESGKGRTPDLVVAPASLYRTALSSQPPMVLLEGRPQPRFRIGSASGWRRYLPVQTRSGAIVIADLSRGQAAEHALGVATHADDLPGAAKRAFARALVRFRLLPPIFPLYAVCAPETTPAFVREAVRRTGLDVVGWFLLVEPGPDHKRLVFFLLTERGPAAVVKFSRLVDDSRKGEREAQGLRAAQAAGPDVVAHAPKLLAQFEISRHHATVQTAAAGQAFTRAMAGRGSRRTRLSQLGAVVEWLSKIAQATSRRRTSLSDDVRRAIADSRLVPEDAEHLVRIASLSPAVFQHGDLADGNVITNLDSFLAIDWELAEPEGFPLWDFIYLAVCALPLLDRAVGDDPGSRDTAHVRYLHDLVRGRAPSSAAFFDWLVELADASGLSLDAVPEIVTLCLLWYSTLQTRLAASGDLPSGSAWAPLTWFAEDWLADPDLGLSWRLWRETIGARCSARSR